MAREEHFVRLEDQDRIPVLYAHSSSIQVFVKMIRSWEPSCCQEYCQEYYHTRCIPRGGLLPCIMY